MSMFSSAWVLAVAVLAAAAGGRIAMVLYERKERPGRERAMATLLSITELPGNGWVLHSEGSRRMGSEGHDTANRLLARSGEFSAVRRFHQADPSRELFVQTGRFLSPDQAGERSVTMGPDTFYRWPGVELLERRDVDDVSVAGLENVHAWEYNTRRGVVLGIQRFIRGTVGSYVVTVSGSSAGAGWSWDDLVEVTTREATHLHALIGG